MKNSKAVLKKIFLWAIFIIFIFFAVCLFTIFKIVSNESVVFDKEKLMLETSKVSLVDANDNELQSVSMGGKPVISIDELSPHTINAFVAIEDKDFYHHKGINLKRIVKAILTNIKSGYAKEGASTISQQTIKNSHLSNEKTLERKIKELFLTMQLEKTFTKNEIMEIYLNIIYFGNGCVGIEQASQTYFDKSASELNIAESATLAGIIKSPQYYSPITNTENCLKRRNLVLGQMLKENYISQEEYETAFETELKTSDNLFSKINSTLYERLAIQEACDKLNISEKELMMSNYKIKTYFEPNYQQILDTAISNNKNLFIQNGENIEHNIMLNDTKTGGLLAIKGYGKNNIFTTKRQPASTIKPILVYAPALEKGIISVDEIIKDEKIDISGYSPQNSYKGYLGDISATKALAISSNTCSVKILNYVGLDNAKDFAKKLHIDFSENDNHLGLALGAMEYGTSLTSLSSAYSSFANGGKYNDIKIIKEIYDENGKLIFLANENPQTAMSEETAYLITNMLTQTSKIGTNKKLANFYPNIASKTGTNGASNGSGNIDAYNISFTPSLCLNIWCGNTSGNQENNLSNEYAGGNYNGIIANSVWSQIAQNEQLVEFTKPNGVIEVELDSIEYNENKKLLLATNQTPDRYKMKSLFNQKYAPTQFSQNFVAPDAPKIELTQNNENEISFSCLPHLEYSIFVKYNDENVINLQTIKNKKGIITYALPEFTDIVEIYVIAEYKNIESNEIIESPRSNIIKLYPKNSEISHYTTMTDFSNFYELNNCIS